MEIYNVTKDVNLANRLYIADKFHSRLIGLLNRSSLDDGEGLLIKPCKAIHTWFMRFAIDVLFLDDNYEVVCQIENMVPGKRSPIIKKAMQVLELRAGTIKKSGTVVGDKLKLKEDK